MKSLSPRLRLYVLLAAGTALPIALAVLGGLAARSALWLAAAGLVAAYPAAVLAVRPAEELNESAGRLLEGEPAPRPVPDPGAPLAVSTRALFELADRLAGERATREERIAERTVALTRKADQLRAVGQIGGQVAALLEPEPLLSFVVRVLRGTFGYDLAAVLLRHGEHLVLSACAARGEEEPPLGRAFPAGGSGAPSLAGCLERGGRISADVSPLSAAVAAQAELAVPIRVSERTLGVLVVQNLAAGTLDEEDLSTAATVAGQVAVALENARLFTAERQLRDLSVTEERNRMAREIHDTLAQGFMGILMQLRAARLAAAGDQAQAFHLQQAEALAQESLQEARRSVWNLRPQKLDGKGLAGALESELAEIGRRTGLRTGLTSHGDLTRIPPPAEAGLLRIAQEALHNAIKYADAASLTVALEIGQEAVTLSVADDGAGFDPAQPRTAGGSGGGGFGLDGMRERARLLGGTLTVASAPGAGCHIIARIPLKEA